MFEYLVNLNWALRESPDSQGHAQDKLDSEMSCEQFRFLGLKL